MLLFFYGFLITKLGILEIFSHRLSQFSSDISDIWLECAQQYCPQNCGTRIFIFLLLIFFYWFLITKNKSKLEILQVFGNFLRKFSMGPHKTWFTCMLWIISSVWKMSLVGQFFGPFLAPNKAKIGNFGGFWPFSQKKNWFQTLKLGLQAYCRYFQACVKNYPCGSNFWPQYPSGTKPNLVAKNWLPTSVTICMGYQNWQPTLVLSFTTWLTQGSLLVHLWNGYQ